MHPLPLNTDLHIFLVVSRHKSFVTAANELGCSVGFVSKRIKILENILQVRLLTRTTRHVALTEDGKKVWKHAQTLLTELQQMVDSLHTASETLSGHLNITSSLGFGRQHVAPILADLSQMHPDLTIRFDPVDKLHDLIEYEIDLDIRIGNEISPHLIAYQLAPNHRILCASPEYLAQYGTPQVLNDLLHHRCLIIKERDHPFGVWKLQHPGGDTSIKVQGHLASNNGEVVKVWALAGLGIILRSVWDVQQEINAGKLVPILTDYKQDANIWAVYPARLNASSTLMVCIQYFKQALQKRLKLV